jgi:AcrR family transcriptional regulator
MVFMNEVNGLRERKKRERRDSIEAAALDLFDAEGFDNTTVENIAAEADIAPRTFFSYFPTKEDVVLADYAGRLERILGELEKRPRSEAPWKAVKASFLLVAHDYESQREELIRRFTIIATNPSVYARSLQLQAGWEDALADSISARMNTAPTDITPRLLAAAALACMRSTLRHWVASGHDSSLPDLAEQCFDQLSEGLAGQF